MHLDQYRITLIAIFVCLITLAYIAINMLDVKMALTTASRQNMKETNIVGKQQQKLLDEIIVLRKEIALLRNRLIEESSQTRMSTTANSDNIVSTFRNSTNSIDTNKHLAHELYLRHKIENNIHEMWYLMNSELKNILKAQNKNDTNNVKSNIDAAQNRITHHYRALLADAIRLTETNDAARKYRQRELNKLHRLVQARFDYLQNPHDCSTAKKLICDMDAGCGFGCQLHHAVYCMIVAYASERMLIVRPHSSIQLDGGWTQLFQSMGRVECITKDTVCEEKVFFIFQKS
jgi:hypothetical protein